MQDFQLFLKYAIEEDIASGDHTSLACIPSNKKGTAQLLAKEEGIIAGMEYLTPIFLHLDSEAIVTPNKKDGEQVKPGDLIATIKGNGIALLSGERLALNLMQRMSGIASYTNYLQTLILPNKAKLLDTRKTSPLLRKFEKEAVKIGGGTNHRFGLYDMVLIKENHIDLAGGVKNALEQSKAYLEEKSLPIKIEIETRNLNELKEVLSIGIAHRVMLDNFSIKDLETAVAMVNGQMETEASGGITEKTIAQVAATGVDYISSGAITHSVKSLDISMLINLND